MRTKDSTTGSPALDRTTGESRLRALFSFPNPVNEVSARLVAGGVVLMVVLTIAFDLRWATAVIAYGFVARVLTGPSLSPLGQLVTRVITPRLGLAERPVAGPPKRFAQGMGVAFSVTALILTILGEWTAAEVGSGAPGLRRAARIGLRRVSGLHDVRRPHPRRGDTRRGVRALQRHLVGRAGFARSLSGPPRPLRDQVRI